MKNNILRAIEVVVTVVIFALSIAGHASADVYAVDLRSDTVYFKVKKDDTLTSISEESGFTVKDIAQQNNIKDINNIKVGQVLHATYKPVKRGDLKNDKQLLKEYYNLDKFKDDNSKHVLNYMEYNDKHGHVKTGTIKQLKKFIINHDIQQHFTIDNINNI